MINKLFSTEQANSANSLPSHPSIRLNQPQPLPYYPEPETEKSPLDGSSKRKYASVDIVVGGVRPKPTKKKKMKKKPQGNPSFLSHPIQVPDYHILNYNESFSLP